ncbi:MAG: hypothetical protein KG003_07535 [Bacteroidetes bacterium]|nr:hypothetical protein [Bacteroidota bacterium]
MEDNLSYSERVKGWTSFHSFIPDWMTRLNNRFFTIKDGQLYLHNDESNPVRNTFYGVKYSSKVRTIFNDSPSDDKIFKNLVIEGDRPWEASLNTNYTEGSIAASEFNRRESRWFAFTRKNEDSSDYNGNAVHGVGVILGSSLNAITFANIGNMISINDNLYQLNGSAEQLIGRIINLQGNVVTVDTIINAPTNGLFCFCKKDFRIEGGEIRGNYLEVELENNDDGDAEIFAITTNAVKSYV